MAKTVAGTLTQAFSVLLVLVALAPAAVVSADDQPTVRVGFYENAPKIFTGADGQPAGFWPQIVDFVAREEGWRVVYVAGTWSECLQRLANGEIDVMPDVAYTEDRAAVYDFGDEMVYASWATVYAPADSGIESVLDLDGKRVAVLADSVTFDGPDGIEELAGAFDVNCAFVPLDNYEAVFDAVTTGSADAAVANKDYGYLYAGTSDLVETAIVFQPSRLYFAFPKDGPRTPELASAFDRYVSSMKQDKSSVYYAAVRVWLTGQSTAPSGVPLWLTVTLAAIAGVAALFAVAGSLLRSQVASRTAELTQEMDRRREAEDALAKSHEHLESLVKQRTMELEEANLHKSQFLANMSHELRTPLNSIIGYTKLMLDGHEGTVTSDQQEDLRTVYDNSKHLLSLINDLLDLSKIEAGKFEIVKDEYPVDDLVAQIVPSMQKLARDKGLYLEYTIAPTVTSIYADKNKTKQILFNLLGNAVKFTGKGGVRLTIERSNDEFVFSIADTGVGIAEKDIASLFQSYKQVGPARLDGSEGTGLGLVITRQFVELQGGRIWVESTAGKGSTFRFTLPAGPSDPGSARSAPD